MAIPGVPAGKIREAVAEGQDLQRPGVGASVTANSFSSLFLPKIKHINRQGCAETGNGADAQAVRPEGLAKQNGDIDLDMDYMKAICTHVALRDHGGF